MKKLWQRSKSRVRGGRERQDSTVSNTTTSKARTFSLRQDTNAPPVPERSANRVSPPELFPPQTSSGNRIQPTLIGISSPKYIYSRPGTAGSIQDAIDEAADNVARGPSTDPLKRKEGHTRNKSSRYVDIFAVHGPQSPGSSYNEDVAERNIDVKKDADSGPMYRYVPSSRYQEEVAARNARAHSQSVDGLKYEHSSPKLDAPRSQSAMAPSHYTPSDKRVHEDDIRRLHMAQVASLQNPHAWNMGTAGVQPAAQVQPPPRQSSDLKTREARHHKKARAMPPVVQPLTTSNLSTVAASSPLPNYHLSQSEVQQRQAELRNTTRPLDQTATKRNSLHERSSSAMSKGSSTRNAITLQGRTIMDLTEEQEEPSPSPNAPSDMSKSPVLEHAQMDAFRRVQPELIVARGISAENAPPSAHPSQAKVAHANRQGFSSPPSAFSTISTIASVSPAIHVNGEPFISIENKARSPIERSEQGPAYRLSTVTETEPEPDRFQTPAGKSRQAMEQASITDTGIQPQRTVPEAAPVKIQMSPESLKSSDFIDPSKAFGVTARDFAENPSNKLSRSDREPNTSAKVKQQRQAAVRGDAVRPIEEFIPESTVPILASESFDEDLFRKKQEQAKAALIKLQQSLNEELAPAKATRPSKPGNQNTRNQSNVANSSGGEPSAGTNNILSQVRSYHTQSNGDIQPPRASSARHRFATNASSNGTRPGSSASNTTVKPMRGRSPSTQSQGKGRELDSALIEMQRLADEMRNPRLVSAPKAQAMIHKQDGNINRFSASTTSTSNSDVIPSPGEVSLSAFPAPSHVRHSRDASLNLPIQNPADGTPPTSNRNSAQSAVASTSGAPFPTVASSTGLPAYIFRTQPGQGYQTPNQRPSSSRVSNGPSQKSTPMPMSSKPNVPQSPGERKTMSRRDSMQSQASGLSSSSQFSIPFHLIPERGSSMRDSLVKEEEDED